MFGRYRVLCQSGAGNDGIRYRALDTETGGEVDLIHLREPVEKRAGGLGRAKRLRLAAMLDHPTARRVVAVCLDGDRPFVVLEPSGADLWSCPSGWPAAVSAAVALAEGLAEGHTLGLTHGRLGPDALLTPLAGPIAPKLDWSGLDAGRRAGQGTGPSDGPTAPILAPEPRDGGGPGPASDVFDLGGLLAGWLAAVPADLDPAPASVLAVLRSVRADDPDDRPSAGQVAARLMTARGGATSDGFGLDSLADFVWPGDSGPRVMTRARLGRFAIREKLGEGGVGVVYRGEDLADGTTVAVKVLHAEWADRPDAVRLLAKEGRLLKDVNNPYVTNLIEVNEDDGIPFLVLEYVAGVTLARRIAEQGPLDERTAVRVLADAARGLAVAHERGVIHRDVKPENLLLVATETADGPDNPILAKVSDFGLARSFTGDSNSRARTGGMAIAGTPLYMAPEQGGGEVGPAADVYAMGATLFHALAGRPPFVGASTFGLIAMHRDAPPPRLQDLNPALGEGVCRVVARSLAKRPEERYADAGRMLLDLERLLRGEPVEPADRPRTPPADPRDLVRFDRVWELNAAPSRLWPHVANVDRINRALGAPAVVGETGTPRDDGRRRGSAVVLGLRLPLTEHPCEWLEGRRFSRVTEFARGPFRWWSSRVELSPRADGGAALTQHVEVSARGLVGRLTARALFDGYTARALGRIYRRIDAALSRRPGRDPLTDPFEPPHALSRRGRAELERWLEALGRRGLDPLAVEAVGDFLASASAAEVASVRPLALAKRLGIDPGQAVAVCLHGLKDGALIALWRVQCPACGETARVVGSLRDLAAEVDCPSCRTQQEVDPARDVELVVRAHPRLREADPGVYALCHPAAAPRAAAQVRIEAGGWALVALDLGEGSYRVRVPGRPEARFEVDPRASVRRLDLALSGLHAGGALPTLRPGRQTLSLTNDTGQERVVRVESAVGPGDALTAARVSALALFRDLFPGEVLPPGRFLSLADVTLVVTELDRPEDLYGDQGDARAFARIDDQFRRLDDHLRRYGGTPVKTLNEGMVAVFDDPEAAVRAALGLSAAMAEGELTRGLHLRVGVHRGPAMAGALDGRLDYFGMTVGVATALPRFAEGGALILSPTVLEAPGVSPLLDGPEYRTTLIPAPLEGLPGSFAYRVDRN